MLLDEYNRITEILNCDLETKSFLITGANGLIGSYMAEYLNSVGAKVYAMSRSVEKLEKRFDKNDGIKIIHQDLNEPLQEDLKFDYIIHAASNSHPLAFSTDPVGTMKTNLLGTINLLEYVRQKGGKLLYLSTGEIYGNNVDHAFTEDDLGVVDTKISRSCYPESKRAAETLCVSYNMQYGVKTNIARLCYVYGPTITDTNSRADAQFLRNALNGEDIIMKSKGLQRRTYCYVSDAVCALLYILIYGENAGFYNVANPNSIASVAEYAQTLADISGVTVKFELPNEIEAKGYSKQANSILSAKKLINLGWKPQFNLKEGIERTYLIKKGLKSC